LKVSFVSIAASRACGAGIGYKEISSC